MTDYSRRKSTLREALSTNAQFLRSTSGGKLKGRYLFRACVRLVIEYADWIGDDSTDGSIGDNVVANVRLARRTKQSDTDLTTKDRSILLIPPKKRTNEDNDYVKDLFDYVKAFKRYPRDVKNDLAPECGYQYLSAGRTVTRQGHKANNLYYVIQGELDIYQQNDDVVIDENVKKSRQFAKIGSLQAGDVFGEIALLHNVPRTATVVSKTAVDLLVVTRYTFDEHLRNHLMEEWDVLRDVFLNFNYFKGWSEETMRDCCILSKIVYYKPNEILLGDGRGMIHYVYFLLEGECKLIEHMLIENKKNRYKIYKPEAQLDDKIPKKRLPSRTKKLNLSSEENLDALMSKGTLGMKNNEMITDDEAHASMAGEFMKMMSKKEDRAHMAMDRISVITVTLQDVINEWHEITDAVEMLMKKPSVTKLQNYPKNIKTVFMEVCTFYRGACFGLGEQMKNRRVVSTTSVKCLLIPRFWLTQRNRANIWERVKNFINSEYPSNDELLRKYVEDRRWNEYKKKYVQRVVKESRNLPITTKLYDVPYSIRINESNN